MAEKKNLQSQMNAFYNSALFLLGLIDKNHENPQYVLKNIEEKYYMSVNQKQQIKKKVTSICQQLNTEINYIQKLKQIKIYENKQFLPAEQKIKFYEKMVQEIGTVGIDREKEYYNNIIQSQKPNKQIIQKIQYLNKSELKLKKLFSFFDSCSRPKEIESILQQFESLLQGNQYSSLYAFCEKFLKSRLPGIDWFKDKFANKQKDKCQKEKDIMEIVAEVQKIDSLAKLQEFEQSQSNRLSKLEKLYFRIIKCFKQMATTKIFVEKICTLEAESVKELESEIKSNYILDMKTKQGLERIVHRVGQLSRLKKLFRETKSITVENERDFFMEAFQYLIRAQEILKNCFHSIQKEYIEKRSSINCEEHLKEKNWFSIVEKFEFIISELMQKQQELTQIKKMKKKSFEQEQLQSSEKESSKFNFNVVESIQKKYEKKLEEKDKYIRYFQYFVDSLQNTIYHQVLDIEKLKLRIQKCKYEYLKQEKKKVEIKEEDFDKSPRKVEENKLKKQEQQRKGDRGSLKQEFQRRFAHIKQDFDYKYGGANKKMEEYEIRVRKLEDFIQRKDYQLRVIKQENNQSKQNLQNIRKKLQEEMKKTMDLQFQLQKMRASTEHIQKSLKEEKEKAAGHSILKEKLQKQINKLMDTIKNKQTQISEFQTTKLNLEKQKSEAINQKICIEKNLLLKQQKLQQLSKQINLKIAQITQLQGKIKQNDKLIQSQKEKRQKQIQILKKSELKLRKQLSVCNIFNTKSFTGMQRLKLELIQKIESYANMEICQSVKIYELDRRIKIENLHGFVDNIQNWVALFKLKNGIIVGLYCCQPISKSIEKPEKGILFSLNLNKYYTLLHSSKYKTKCYKYEEFHLIFGNGEIYYKFNQNSISSSAFGGSHKFFDTGKDTPAAFFGQQSKSYELQSFQFFQLVLKSR